MLSSDSAYVALSYCWSKKRYSMLELANLEDLSIPGGLKSLNLPPTITDAMIAMRAIDERYIWIDSLCIIQDDHANKAAELARMDDIYRAASLTIIAAATPLDGTEVGLPGVNVDPGRQDTATLELRGLKFRQSVEPLRHSLIRTKWHSRAWTFQEYLLSKRYLIFMPEQAYFVCQRATFAEDHIDHICVRESNPSVQTLIPCCALTSTHNDAYPKETHRPQHLISGYEDILLYYTMREMSFDADAINAVRGLLRLLEREYGTPFLCGLPVPHLIGYFLTWIPVGSSIEREMPLEAEVGFPSWSWAGWRGQVRYASTVSLDLPAEKSTEDGFGVDGIQVTLESEITQWKAILRPNKDSEDNRIPSREPEIPVADFASIDQCFLEFTAEIASFSICANLYGAIANSFVLETERSTCRHILANGIQVGSVLMHDSRETHPPHLDPERLQNQTFVALSRAKARWTMWYPMHETDPSDFGNRSYEQDDG